MKRNQVSDYCSSDFAQPGYREIGFASDPGSTDLHVVERVHGHEFAIELVGIILTVLFLVAPSVDRDTGAVIAGELGAGVAGRQLQFADLHGFAVSRIEKLRNNF